MPISDTFQACYELAKLGATIGFAAIAIWLAIDLLNLWAETQEREDK